jgi:hypothetical protein
MMAKIMINGTITEATMSRAIPIRTERRDHFSGHKARPVSGFESFSGFKRIKSRPTMPPQYGQYTGDKEANRAISFLQYLHTVAAGVVGGSGINGCSFPGSGCRSMSVAIHAVNNPRASILMV